MKKLLSIGILLLISLSVNAQGNLQFNQVKLVTATETVPAGKVWKVEAASFAGGTPFCIGAGPNSLCGQVNLAYTGFQASMSYNINGQNAYIAQAYNGNSVAQSGIQVNNPFPLWLPQGTTLAAGANMRHLSVIEFNVVP